MTILEKLQRMRSAMIREIQQGGKGVATRPGGKCPNCGGRTQVSRDSENISVCIECRTCSSFSVKQRRDIRDPSKIAILVEWDFDCEIYTFRDTDDMKGRKIIPVTMTDNRIVNVRMNNGVVTGCK